MRMLIVEDNPDSVRDLRAALEAMDVRASTAIVDNREAACELLAAESDFDFIMCDLHIPRVSGEEPALEHGLAVYECATNLLPGTPTMLITGSGDERGARERIAARGPEDIFGVGEPYPMTDLIYKHEPEVYAQRIADIAIQLEQLERIEIYPMAHDLTLTHSQARVLRIFARRHHTHRIELLALGGLSDSIAVRATLFTEEREFIAAVFAKIARLDFIEEERARYQEAALRLPAGSYAPLLETITAGAGGYGGLFYGLADRHQDALFGHVLEHPDESATVVEELRDFLGAWRADRRDPEEVLVTTLRRDRVASSVIEPFVDALGPGWRDFEQQKVPVRRSLQHGDLHGANVLIGDSAMPLLIDFGNVEDLPSCFDPVVLELSLVFHSESPFRNLSWPTIEQCDRWDDLEFYVRRCPAARFVRACREWALSSGAAPSTVYAVAYAEALRQLEYAHNETERALGIARAAARRGMIEVAAGAMG
jgi:CheY-like chemotaxis protein